LGDIFDGLFGGGGGRSGGGPGPRPQQAPPKGANIAYAHLVSFTDAATLAPQRIMLGDGKTVEFKLPAGIVAGQQIRIPGKGQPGPGGYGDAMVTLKIGKHPHLVRDGDNVHIDLPISLKEAVEGGKVKVPTVDGAVMLTVPPRTNSGAVLRIKGRGFTAKTGVRGDQLVTLMIHLPTDTAELARIRDVLSDSSVRENMGV
jgi:DnaJ-class molecular chaperone